MSGRNDGEEGQGLTKSSSVRSVESRGSSDLEEENETLVDSVNLLATGGGEDENLPRNDPGLTGQINEEVIRRAVKRATDPILYEVKRLKQQNDLMDKKLTQVLTSNDQLQKLVKEFKAESNKGVEDLSVLLTSEGIQHLKTMCVRNLYMYAKDEAETELMQNFIERAKEEAWLIKTSNKAEKDILSKYRDNRNYMKSQIRLRVYEDLSNQTPDTSAKLLKTLKFLRENLAVPTLSNDLMLVIYNYAYTVLKYNNKANENMTTDELTIQKEAQANLWTYVNKRVDKDIEKGVEASSIKKRISRTLKTGLKFDPY